MTLVLCCLFDSVGEEVVSTASPIAVVCTTDQKDRMAGEEGLFGNEWLKMLCKQKTAKNGSFRRYGKTPSTFSTVIGSSSGFSRQQRPTTIVARILTVLV